MLCCNVDFLAHFFLKQLLLTSEKDSMQDGWALCLIQYVIFSSLIVSVPWSRVFRFVSRILVTHFLPQGNVFRETVSNLGETTLPLHVTVVLSAFPTALLLSVYLLKMSDFFSISQRSSEYAVVYWRILSALYILRQSWFSMVLWRRLEDWSGGDTFNVVNVPSLRSLEPSLLPSPVAFATAHGSSALVQSWQRAGAGKAEMEQLFGEVVMGRKRESI